MHNVFLLVYCKNNTSSSRIKYNFYEVSLNVVINKFVFYFSLFFSLLLLLLPRLHKSRVAHICIANQCFSQSILHILFSFSVYALACVSVCPGTSILNGKQSFLIYIRPCIQLLLPIFQFQQYFSLSLPIYLEREENKDHATSQLIPPHLISCLFIFLLLLQKLPFFSLRFSYINNGQLIVLIEPPYTPSTKKVYILYNYSLYCYYRRKWQCH